MIAYLLGGELVPARLLATRLNIGGSKTSVHVGLQPLLWSLEALASSLSGSLPEVTLLGLVIRILLNSTTKNALLARRTLDRS